MRPSKDYLTFKNELNIKSLKVQMYVISKLIAPITLYLITKIVSRIDKWNLNWLKLFEILKLLKLLI